MFASTSLVSRLCPLPPPVTRLRLQFPVLTLLPFRVPGGPISVLVPQTLAKLLFWVTPPRQLCPALS